eukprot:9483546-Pyramimonas_sp.AAC.1
MAGALTSSGRGAAAPGNTAAGALLAPARVHEDHADLEGVWASPVEARAGAARHDSRSPPLLQESFSSLL